MRTGIFTGTFDPFTNGHHNIVERALPLFDHLIVAVVGDNVNKPNMTPAEQRRAAIARLYEDTPQVSVEVFNGLAVDFARSRQARFIVKGIRSVKDFEYEREQADINRQISGVDTLFFFSEPQLASLSSSVVRELRHFGLDVSRFVPGGESC